MKKGKVKYTEELFYDLFPQQEKIALETYEECWKIIRSQDVFDAEEEIKKNTLLNYGYIISYDSNDEFKKAIDEQMKLVLMETKCPQKKILESEYHHYKVKERNQRWLPVLIKNLEEKKSLLIVVGMMHIPLEGGLLALLLKEGYQIFRIHEDGTEEEVTEANRDFPFL